MVELEVQLQHSEQQQQVLQVLGEVVLPRG
jgi:hypothetical protein